MTSKTNTKRSSARLLALALGLAAILAPAALADPRAPDTIDAARAAQTALPDGRAADTLDAVDAARSPILADGWLQGAIEQGSSVSDGRSADTLDAVSSSAVRPPLGGRPPVFLRAADVSPAAVSADGWLPAAIEQGATASDGRSADTLDAAGSAQVQASVDGRSPDTIAAAFLAHEPVVTLSVTGFDWVDAAIGFGAAAGLALLGVGVARGLRGNGRESDLPFPSLPA